MTQERETKRSKLTCFKTFRSRGARGCNVNLNSAVFTSPFKANEETDELSALNNGLLSSNDESLNASTCVLIASMADRRLKDEKTANSSQIHVSGREIRGLNW